jgi:hypothetical protein
MWRKTHGWAGVLVAVVLLFGGCEKEGVGEEGALVGAGNENIKINFTLSHTPYGESELRSGDRELASETVVVPVDNEWNLTATLAEDGEDPLRAGPETIADGTRLRIVAYSSGSPVGNAEYKVTDSSGGIEPVGMGLTVPSAGTYTFVAYSWNSTTTAPAYSATTIGIGNMNYDLLWGSKEEPIAEGINNVSIKMNHMLSQVKVQISAPMNISAAAGRINPRYPLTLTVATGAMTTESSSNYDILSWTGAGTTTITGTGWVHTKQASPTRVIISSLTINEDTYKNLPYLTFNMALQLRYSYTFTVSYTKKTTVFAGSNIYWKWNNDTDHTQGGYLTFDKEGEGNQMRQGVFFKWGSLVGISPALTGGSTSMDNANTPIYYPTYTSGGTPSVTWVQTTVTDAGIDGYMEIPYTKTAAGGIYSSYLMEDVCNNATAWGARKGDICRFLSENGFGPGGKYRMPTAYEMGANERYQYVGTAYPSSGWAIAGGSGWADLSSQAEEDGSYSMPYGASNTGIVFPPAGTRPLPSYFALLYIGTVGTYWSGSSDALAAYYLSISDTNIYRYNSGPNERGLSVRCVQNN